ncbi:MAG TPA: Flp family type IVb pilin [Candidatus Limnocylindria bacterium]|nr:Flp family type IVb pilin [Candidatus Limnocylindria bacterium]
MTTGRLELRRPVCHFRSLVSRQGAMAMRGRFSWRDESGASAVEYGLLIAGIAALIVSIVFLFGGMVTSMFSSTCSTVTSEAQAHSAAISASCS